MFRSIEKWPPDGLGAAQRPIKADAAIQTNGPKYSFRTCFSLPKEGGLGLKACPAPFIVV